jgi:hypothetical protein
MTITILIIGYSIIGIVFLLGDPSIAAIAAISLASFILLAWIADKIYPQDMTREQMLGCPHKDGLIKATLKGCFAMANFAAIWITIISVAIGIISIFR